MTRREFRGAAATLVQSGAITASDLSIVTTGTVTGWPTGATGKFLVVIDKGLSSEEKILVTSRSGNTLTVASTGDRGADATTAVSHSSGAQVQHVAGAIDVDEPNDHINTTTLDHHTQYVKADGTRFPNATHDVTARHAFGAALGAPGTPAAVDQATGSVGAGTVPARDNHVHAQPAATPRGLINYTEKSGAYNLTTSYTDVPGFTTGSVTTVAGRRYKITAVVPINIGVNGSAIDIKLLEDSTDVAFNGSQNTSTSSIEVNFLPLMAIRAPSAGSHTYKIQARFGGSSGIIQPFPNNGVIMVEDIGI